MFPKFDQNWISFIPEHKQEWFLERLKARYQALIEPHIDIIKGMSVLDLASCTGIWTAVALNCGATHVTAVENNQSFNDQAKNNLHNYKNYQIINTDLHNALCQLPPTFDTILCFGYGFIQLAISSIKAPTSEIGHRHLFKQLRKFEGSSLIFDGAVDKIFGVDLFLSWTELKEVKQINWYTPWLKHCKNNGWADFEEEFDKDERVSFLCKLPQCIRFL